MLEWSGRRCMRSCRGMLRRSCMWPMGGGSAVLDGHVLLILSLIFSLIFLGE